MVEGHRGVGVAVPTEAGRRPRPRASARSAAGRCPGRPARGPRTAPSTASTRPAPTRRPRPASRRPARTARPRNRCRRARRRGGCRTHGRSTYAPPATPAIAPSVPCRRAPGPSAGTGSARSVRRRRCGCASAAAVSLASAGRITRRPGMARIAASCSTGWCVGPSSPTPTESCDHTNATLYAAQRREPYRPAAVVGEDEERAAEREQAAHRHAVHHRVHAVLTDAEVDLTATERAGLEDPAVRHGRARCCR